MLPSPSTSTLQFLSPLPARGTPTSIYYGSQTSVASGSQLGLHSSRRMKETPSVFVPCHPCSDPGHVPSLEPRLPLGSHPPTAPPWGWGAGTGTRVPNPRPFHTLSSPFIQLPSRPLLSVRSGYRLALSCAPEKIPHDEETIHHVDGAAQ